MSILSSIADLFTGSSASAAAQAQAAAAAKAYGDYSTLANTAIDTAKTAGGQAQDTWSRLLAGSGAGAASYADATGVNGPEGLARARAAFSGITQPSIDMALDAMTR